MYHAAVLAVQVLISVRAIIAPSGIPLAIPLAAQRISGSMPQCSLANIFPVRPKPDWISSTTSSIPCLRQSASGHHSIEAMAPMISSSAGCAESPNVCDLISGA